MSHNSGRRRKRRTANGTTRQCRNRRGKKDVLLKLFGYKCLKCNKPLTLDRATLDHVTPVSQGGSHNITNFQVLCERCNGSKKDTSIDYRPLETLTLLIEQKDKIYELFK